MWCSVLLTSLAIEGRSQQHSIMQIQESHNLTCGGRTNDTASWNAHWESLYTTSQEEPLEVAYPDIARLKAEEIENEARARAAAIEEEARAKAASIEEEARVRVRVSEGEFHLRRAASEPSVVHDRPTAPKELDRSSSTGDEPKLPAGWERRTTEDDRVYYVDHHTKTTSWTLEGTEADPSHMQA